MLASWTEITSGVGFFHFNLLWILAGIIAVFLALDLFLFYFAWELMLVPMYFLIAIWGHERRVYAAVKFFLFTQLSGLLMLIAILALYFAHYRSTGVYTFEYADLLQTPLNPHAAMWIMLGFFIAFAVKLPMIPVPYLAGGCTYSGAHGRQRHPGRTAPQDGRLRLDSLRSPTVSGRRPGVRSRGDDAGGGGDSLWRHPAF